MRYVETFFYSAYISYQHVSFFNTTPIHAIHAIRGDFFYSAYLSYLHVSYFNPYTDTRYPRDTWKLFSPRIFHICTYLFSTLTQILAIHAIRGDFFYSAYLIISSRIFFNSYTDMRYTRYVETSSQYFKSVFKITYVEVHQ